ncbi:hypothetical protein [Persicobacter psychrovividus]|uniref:Secreted protein n=1 Tax=Persicobacter psychrovividus TaxID=387638 RepID=A0ABM7VDK0_9BACT|nr:hypothetical protein PEPS_12940 [Persicobacter psychrovividus]
MKKFLVLYLTINILIASFARIGVVFTYEVFQDYIAQNLCENRFEPITVCYGSCFVKNGFEQIETAAQSTQQQAQGTPVNIVFDFFSNELFAISLPKMSDFTGLQHHAWYLNLYVFLQKGKVFIPPVAV